MTTPSDSTPSAICTLFEGDFHYGVGALVNSLYAAGFRGDVWVGHRGPLPPWASTARRDGDGAVLEIAADCRIHFIPVETPRHLTNYKAVFMRRVFEQLDPACARLYYFDPDIVVRAPWSYFVDWAFDAIGLSEDVNSPVPSTHPKRNRWRRRFPTLTFRTPLDLYANGGFVGVPRAHASFLVEWEAIIAQMEAGGIATGDSHFQEGHSMWVVDQDALNISAMNTAAPLSLCGKDGMGFIATSGPMLHQIGRKKPWHRRFLSDLLTGMPPSPTQRLYWQHLRAPIRLYSDAQIRRGQMENLIASFVARFYRR